MIYHDILFKLLFFLLECPQLPSSIPNGRANGTGSLHGALFVYSCLQGYSLIGQKTLLCTEDGNWNASVPKCLKGIFDSWSKRDQGAERSVKLLQLGNIDSKILCFSNKISELRNFVFVESSNCLGISNLKPRVLLFKDFMAYSSCTRTDNRVISG